MSELARDIIAEAARGRRIEDDAAHHLVEADPAVLTGAAGHLRDAGHGRLVTYSRKVFIPLTQLCRDTCRYCTFAHPPRAGAEAYLSPEEVLAIARAGAKAGCREALFTLGDKPELRYRAAREALDRLGHPTTLAYLEAMAALVLKETGLLPHVNAGVMDEDDIRRLRRVSVSQGLMLETAADRLSARGGPHFGSPDKVPAVRLATIEAAGRAAVPFTSGILIGIGETRRERIEALLALRRLHDAHGHLQEIIVQNFRAKPGTQMAEAPEPALAEQLWTIAVARLLFGPEMSIQSPPNLRPEGLADIVAAGIDDWGGVSPVTPDHVNPEAPWPEIERLAGQTAAAGATLVERLAIYPRFARARDRWVDGALHGALLRQMDGEGLARGDAWISGSGTPPPRRSGPARTGRPSRAVAAALDKARSGRELGEAEIVALLGARGADVDHVAAAADALRRARNGDTVSYVVTRNINYTNICTYRCKFCAFSKGKLAANLRGRPYDLDADEIARRTHEAWARGASEVCLQGGIHPDYTGRTYLDICRTVKSAAPGIHVHAFSPLEITQGAATLGWSVGELLRALKSEGLGSLPGTAAEILDDEVRAVICPDKIDTAQWLHVMREAHRAGLRTTATIMFGHVEGAEHVARHLLHVRRLQAETGGFTEFVPLGFVPMETPIYLKGAARQGPTWREALLVHAVARLVLDPVLTDIQVSWVKMGPEGARACLSAGANDLGGTLMNETITRSAGAVHGEEMAPAALEAIIRAAGRRPRQRTTLYADAPADRITQSFAAAALVANAPPEPGRRAAP